jgi:hypothetical protein
MYCFCFCSTGWVSWPSWVVNILYVFIYVHRRTNAAVCDLIFSGEEIPEGYEVADNCFCSSVHINEDIQHTRSSGLMRHHLRFSGALQRTRYHCPCGLPHRLVHRLARDRALALLRIPRLGWINGQRWNPRVCCQLHLSSTRLAAKGRNEAKFKLRCSTFKEINNSH